MLIFSPTKSCPTSINPNLQDHQDHHNMSQAFCAMNHRDNTLCDRAEQSN